MQTINARLLLAVGAAAVLCHSSLAWAQPPGPDLTITLTHSGNFTVGVTGTYTIVCPTSGRWRATGSM